MWFWTGGDLIHDFRGPAHDYILSELDRRKGELRTQLVWIGAQKEPGFTARVWKWVNGELHSTYYDNLGGRQIPSKQFMLILCELSVVLPFWKKRSYTKCNDNERKNNVPPTSHGQRGKQQSEKSTAVRPTLSIKHKYDGGNSINFNDYYFTQSAIFAYYVYHFMLSVSVFCS